MSKWPFPDLCRRVEYRNRLHLWFKVPAEGQATLRTTLIVEQHTAYNPVFHLLQLYSTYSGQLITTTHT
jgi:hypothetical protein